LGLIADASATFKHRTVAQISNLLYRRFPIGRAWAESSALERSGGLRVGNPRYSRLETCATPKKRFDN
jgi:hypothetical protein